ncbi:hypothetical protein GCM10023107_01200 [Actinoplanes octamycinicus]
MSFWLDSLGPIERRTALPGDRDADVAIVGGGYTGLWTAFYLARARPDLRIVVLEAEFCGFGASGRNGGWASGLFPVSEAALTRRFGADAAKAMHAALAGAVDEVGRAGIDCDYAKGGVISLIRTPGQLRRAPADRLDAARPGRSATPPACSAASTASTAPHCTPASWSAAWLPRSKNSASPSTRAPVRCP